MNHLKMIKNLIVDFDFKVISLIYFIGAITVLMKFPTLINNQTFSILSLLLSTIFLFCAYQNKKSTVEKMMQNGIIKWIATGLIFSICMWYSKHKFNFDYEIESDYLDSSVYGYAIAMTIPTASLIYGACIFSYLYLRKLSAVKYFYALLITFPIFFILEDFIKKTQKIDYYILISLVISFALGCFYFLQGINNTKQYKRGLISVYRIIFSNCNKRKIIIYIWLKKAITATNRILNTTSLASIIAALFFIGMFMLNTIPKYQKSFLLLDAYYTTDCTQKKDSFLYIRKSKTQCYKIESNGIDITKMTPFTAP